MPYILSSNQLDNFIKKNNLAGDSVVEFLKDTNYATKDLTTYQKYLVDTGQTITQFASMTKSAGNILKSFGATLASTGVMMLAGVAISGAAKLFSNWVNEAKNAETAASGFSESLNKLNSDYSSNSAKITELNKRYQELSKGVNSLGKNNSLTSSEYDEYKNIISQISDIMPSLSVRFDEQGDKIGFVKGQLEDLNEEYQKYQQNMASNLLYNGNDEGQTADDIIKNVKYQTSNPWYSSMFGGGWTLTKSVGHGLYDRFGLNYLFGDLKFDMDDVESLYSNKEIVNLANSLASYSKEELVDALEYNSKNSDDTYEVLVGYTADEVAKMTDAEFEAVRETLSSKASVYQDKVVQAYSNFRNVMLLSLQTNDDYYKLGDNSSYLSNIISGLSNDFIDKNDLLDSAKKKTFTNQLLSDFKSNANQITSIFNNLGKIDPLNLDKLSIPDAKGQIDDYLKQLSTYLKIDSNELKISLGFDNIDTLSEDYNKTIDKVKTKSKNQTNFLLDYWNGANKFTGQDAAKNAEKATKIIKDLKDELDFDWDSWFKNNSINTQEEIDTFNKLYDTIVELGEPISKVREEYEKLAKTLEETDIHAKPALENLTELLSDFESGKASDTDASIKSISDVLKSAKELYSDHDYGSSQFKSITSWLTDGLTSVDAYKKAMSNLNKVISFTKDNEIDLNATHDKFVKALSKIDFATINKDGSFTVNAIGDMDILAQKLG
ncbi:hypothetical protein, partial [uncultured Thomasclavelia sp.]|uniref:hypothetical protein n=1 Tax=uncultured Thomasclavelia sp. TaxID=3025759 RepID=UPI00280B62B3